MRKLLSVFPVLVLAFAWFTAAAQAENWPCWRGPRGDGTSIEKNVPTQWNGKTGENIHWKVLLPGEGHASPIVWEDRIFTVSCLTDTQERILICLNTDGKILWQKTVLKAPLESKHNLNSFASGTPATDGKLVYVTFLEVGEKKIDAPNVGRKRKITPGQMVVAAYDFAGNQQWLVRPGPFVSAHGYCSCPLLYKDLVIVNGDHDGDSYIVALNKSTGEVVWKTPRAHKTRSYVTPLIRTIDGRTQMVFSGSRHIVSLNPADGSQYWKIEGPTQQFVASMVYDGEKFYMAAGFPTYHVMGIKPDGQGDVTESHVAWHTEKARCYVPSPVVIDKYLLVADDRGTANCYDTATGERYWLERLGKHYSASLVTAGGLAYFVADDGIAKLVKPGPKLNVVQENELGEFTFASPAISNGRLYIRGEKNLYSIGGKAAE